ncbi:LETM1-like protein domain-containing protein [Ditylenchus destructor]|uniref:LETM1-like protein domain-containing protein n=1 Tax=Ditylenchus destructor TaxID=166010 RepID=A0AAD4R263_9BILA|nr:LETM1-like protein domain-containing protein [Ditylenchus destructor]
MNMIVRCYRPLIRGAGIYQTLYRSGQFNHGHLGLLVRWSSTEKSKVEETLQMLKDDLLRQQEEDARRKQIAPASKEKLSVKTRVVNEIMHYYHGFRLLALETRLSMKYVWRLARGSSLSRRERQQLVRTVSDLLRLLPFSFFIIVPFMEFALPFFIKFFPNMLPSTFQEASKEEEKIRRQLKVRTEMAKFLQDTLEEIALERKSKAKDSEKESKAYEFSQFLRKLRTEGGYVSNTDLFKFTKLFEDELTLDNLSMSQLRALCRILSIPPLGTPEILRFQLHMKLRDLKADDRMIAAEGGVDALSVQELQSACRARGMRALGVSEERLRNQLKQWLELSLSDKVPPSLLLLSRAIFFPEEINFIDRIRTILSVLPEELGEQTKQKLTELEGGKIDPKERLDLIKSIEKHLNHERQQAKEAEKRQEAEKSKAAKEEAKPKPKHIDEVIDAAQRSVEKLHESVVNLSSQEKVEPFGAVTEEKDVQKAKETKAAKIDKDVLESIEDIIHGNPIQEARHDITGLKEKVIEHSEDLIEVGSLARDEYKETKIAKRLRARVNSMISGMDSLMAKIENERRHIKEEISGPASADKLAAKEERLVKITDLLDSLKKLQRVADDAKSKRIEEILHAIDVDKDGSIDAPLVLEVIELLGKHKDVELNPPEMAKIIEMLKKEDVIEALDRDTRPAENDPEDAAEQLEAILPKLPADEEFPVRSLVPPSILQPPSKEAPKNTQQPKTL